MYITYPNLSFADSTIGTAGAPRIPSLAEAFINFSTVSLPCIASFNAPPDTLFNMLKAISAAILVMNWVSFLVLDGDQYNTDNLLPFTSFPPITYWLSAVTTNPKLATLSTISAFLALLSSSESFLYILFKSLSKAPYITKQWVSVS